ncbi:MAG: sensor histidine kinase [Candidatus Dormibacteraceae bacterium]
MRLPRLRVSTWTPGLQTRLVAGTLGLVVLLLIGVGVFQYVALRASLLQHLSDSLHRQAHYAIAGRGRPSSATSDPAALARDASSPDVRAGVVGNGTDLLSLGPAGPGNLAWIPPSAAAIERATGTDAVPDYWLLGSGGDSLLVVAVPLGPDAGTSQTLVLEGSLQPTDAVLRGDLFIYAAGSALAVLLGAVLSLFMTGRALKRLHRVAVTAAAVADGDLGRRAAIAGTDEVAALGAVFDDMVGKLQAEMSRQQASETAMRRFLADASHELRTPIALIRGNLDILRRGAAADPADRALSMDDMHRAAVRMSRLVDDLLALARIEQGDRPQVADLDVRSILQEAARSGRQIAKGRRIKVEVPTPIRVAADPDALSRVLQNLIDNAIKYAPAPSPITLIARAGAAGTVQIEVVDQGPGIATEDQGRIFDRFYRGQQRASTAGGTGLGLAISAALIESQGGNLAVRSNPGKGSTFVLTLPSPESRAGRARTGRQFEPIEAQAGVSGR